MCMACVYVQTCLDTYITQTCINVYILPDVNLDMYYMRNLSGKWVEWFRYQEDCLFSSHNIFVYIYICVYVYTKEHESKQARAKERESKWARERESERARERESKRARERESKRARVTNHPPNPWRHLRAYCHHTRAIPIRIRQLLLFHRLCYCLPIRPQRTLGSDTKKL
jgi:hypothetical protein